MREYVLTAALLIVLTRGARATDGIVLEVTPDAIIIQQGGIKTLTFFVTNELMTNTSRSFPNTKDSAKLIDVKKGSKVDLWGGVENGRLICFKILLRPPSDIGTVTEVGKDTITIHNDKGKTTTYKVYKYLVDNSRADIYTSIYPSRFAEVTPGCRIEVDCYKENGELIIKGIDVKKEKDK